MGIIPAYWSEWAQGPSLALGSVIIFSWWVFIGYYSMLYLNGLSNIPRQLYEAAEVDGASRLRSFFSITVPLLSPTTYLLSILGIMGTFKAFTHIYVLRHAAAGGTVDPVSVFIFFTYFRKSRLGYASAISLLLFAIVLGLTILQRRTEKRLEYGD
jgi:multiple sugar transport system permease protein